MAPAKGKKPALQCLNWFMLHVHWFEVESQLWKWIVMRFPFNYQPERNEPWRPTLSAAEGICGWIWRWRWHCDSQHHRGSSPIWKSHLRKKPVPLAKVMETAGCRLVHLIAVIIPFHCHCPVTTRPILTLKHLLYLVRNYGLRNSEFRTCRSITTTSLLNYTCLPLHHSRAATKAHVQETVRDRHTKRCHYARGTHRGEPQKPGNSAGTKEGQLALMLGRCHVDGDVMKGYDIGIKDSKTAVLSDSFWVQSLHA